MGVSWDKGLLISIIDQWTCVEDRLGTNQNSQERFENDYSVPLHSWTLTLRNIEK